MRSLPCLLLSCALILAAGCSTARAVPPTEPTPQPTADDPLPGISPGPDPVQTAKALLETDGDFHWREPPTAYVVQQMTYADAHRYIPMLSPEYAPDVSGLLWTRETPVYLVALRGRWVLTPMGPPGAAPVPYEGCLFVLFSAADGRLIATGDTTCPGKG